MDSYHHPIEEGRAAMHRDEGPARAPRLGKPEDLDRMMALTMTASDENSFVRPSVRKILEDVYAAVHGSRGLIWLIGPDEGPLEAAALLRIGETWYSDELVLEERGIYVHPHYRHSKGRRHHMLVEACVKTAHDLELPLMIGVLSNQRTEGKIRLYQRLLGPPAGVIFLVNGKTGVHLDAHTGGAVREDTPGD